MKIEELLETFDKPYPLSWEEGTDGDARAFAKLPDGTTLLIMFNHEGNEEYQVEFHRGNSLDVTGEGDAYKIFATVLHAIQKFIKERSPEMIFFSGEKGNTGTNPSRTKLYTRMVQKFARQLGYNTYIEDQGDMVQYELTKLNKEVKENMSKTATAIRRKEHELGLEPGDEDWFKLWFTRPFLSGAPKLRKKK
jgi:hypothetical protein